MATLRLSAKRLQIVVAIACLSPFGNACGWDNDTLSAEAKGLPVLLDALVGRVPIYPNEYYNFRISRSAQIVAKDPNNLVELDNLTVAYDKLGNTKLAFLYSDLKYKALLRHPDKEHEYRYYANRGTIEAHAWIRGSNHEDKHLLDQSIADLNKCIAINPNAHFGREIVQVKLIELIRDGVVTKYPSTKSSWLKYAEPPDTHLAEWDKFVTKIGAPKVQQGLIGIMTLGGGPDSPDILCALIPTMPIKKGVLRELALRRIDDLWKQKPLFSSIGYAEELGHPADEKTFDSQYKALTLNTKVYRETLAEFIRKKVSQGKHPDVDSHFWDDWKEPEHVNLASMEPTLTPIQALIAQGLGVVGLIILGLGLIVLGLLKLVRKYFRPNPKG